MKYLILGATGMAGHTIALYLQENNNEVIGFVRNETDLFDCVVGNAHDLSMLNNLVRSNHFDIVVNAIGLLNQTANSNPDEAVFLNSYLPHYLSSITKDINTRVFHLSTDCVFAGNTGPYNENSIPDGKTFYDRSKALGELNDHKNITFRNSIIGPDLKPDGIGLLNWFLQQEKEVKGYSGAIWTGLSTLELAKAIAFVSSESCAGLVNMVPDEAIAKYDLLKLFNTYINKNRLEIIPFDDFQLDKTLIRDNRDSDFLPLGYDEQIKELSLWIKKHEKLYPHYSARIND